MQSFICLLISRGSELSKEYETAIRKAELLEEELQAVREEATHSNEDSQAKLQALSRYVKPLWFL